VAPAVRVFELRTYTAQPGKLDALLARFRDHTMALFAKHRIAVSGFWVELDTDGQRTQRLIYLLAHDSREAAGEAWEAFRTDPAWIAARAASEADGPLVADLHSVFVAPTDFSPLS
jgi:hypothetical protein